MKLKVNDTVENLKKKLHWVDLFPHPNHRALENWERLKTVIIVVKTRLCRNETANLDSYPIHPIILSYII